MQFTLHYFILFLVVIKTVHAIVGGKEVSTLGEYPFIVSVISKTREGSRLKCGGALLSPNKVITSARCVDGETASSLTIKCGSLNRNEMPLTSSVSGVKIPVSFYNEGAVTPFLYDVAVLTLSSSIAETDSIKYIPALPTAEPSFNEGGSDSATVSFAGWGRTSKDDMGLPSMLQTIELPLLSQCTTSTTNTTAIQQCIGGDGKGACVGDEGGPVMYNNQLVGILSQGSCGAPDVQNVYTSTIAVRDFLNSS